MTKTLTGYDVLVYVKVSKQRHLKQCNICILLYCMLVLCYPKCSPALLPDTHKTLSVSMCA